LPHSFNTGPAARRPGQLGGGFLLAASYPFLDVLWTMIVIFAWVIWFWLLITVFSDLFRRSDISGWGKAGWIILVVVLPYFGVFIYLIAQHQGMTERSMAQAQRQQSQFDDYVKSVATTGGGGAAAEIEKAKQLLDSGAITQAEFDSLKAKALAAG
jgi:hypothetical protein